MTIIAYRGKNRWQIKCPVTDRGEGQNEKLLLLVCGIEAPPDVSADTENVHKLMKPS